jgi:hypothetical protein
MELALDASNYIWTKTTNTYSEGATAVPYAVAGKQGIADATPITVVL